MGKRVLVVISMCGFIALACTVIIFPTPVRSPTPTPMVSSVFYPTMAFTLPPPIDNTRVFTSEDLGSYIPSNMALDFLGEYVTVGIEKASCSYRTDINGAPTFCNDKPYPNHTFTLLVWGQDWGFLDGECILVAGVVSVYNGKPQIIAETLDQVSFCE